MGCYFLLQGNLLDAGIEPVTPESPALQANSLRLEPTGPGNKIKVLARRVPSALGFFFFFLLFGHLAWHVGSVSLSGLEPLPPALEAQSLNCWTTSRELPGWFLLRLSGKIHFPAFSCFWIMPFPEYLDSCPPSIHLQSQQKSILKSLSDCPFQCHISSSDSDFPASLL